MKIINCLLLFCCISTMVYAAQKTSPEKHVAFKSEGTEPLLQGELGHMARSVSSDGPPFEGGMRMQKIVITPIEEETPDAAEIVPSRSTHRSQSSKNFNFDVSAVESAPAAARPKPAPSPRSGVGITLKSPSAGRRSVVPSPRAARSRRGSVDSSGDDPEIREFINARCHVAGKNTPNTRRHFRQIAAAQRVAINTDTTIDGEPLSAELFVDKAVLDENVPSREGSIAGQGDLAQRELLVPLIPLTNTDLTPERIAYLKRLKAAHAHYEKGFRSFSPSYIAASAADKHEAIVNKLTDIFHDYYYGNDTWLDQVMDDDERALVDRDLKQAHDELGCCSSCVIL